MLIYVYGGSGSGKSSFAESLTVSLGGMRIYLATMHLGEGDWEGQKRIDRHRRLREGKGFITIEQERKVASLSRRLSSPGTAYPSMDGLSSKKESACEGICLSKASILLEDLPNLLANEMFGESPRFQVGKGEGLKKDKQERLFTSPLSLGIFRELLALSDSCQNLILVGGDIFSDGIRFKGEMEEYLRALGEISQGICERASYVYEVVYGLPICHKAKP